MTSEPLKYLKPLKKSDLIGIAASSSPFNRDAFLEGIQILQSFGFQTFYRDDIFEQKDYLAGGDQRRAEELIELLEKPDIKAILFARGGYGMMRVLPQLEKYKTQKLTPKIICGYSDVTPLLLYINQKWNWPCFYGPVVAKDISHKSDPLTINSLKESLSSKNKQSFLFEETEVLQKGEAEGKISGGCLSMINATLATPYEIESDNKILFLEDINEKPYQVDRMLTQLKLAGKFNKVRGFIFGSFEKGAEAQNYKEVIQDCLSDFNVPILFNFPFGHGPKKVTLAMGLKLAIDNKHLTYLESPYS